MGLDSMITSCTSAVNQFLNTRQSRSLVPQLPNRTRKHIKTEMPNCSPIATVVYAYNEFFTLWHSQNYGLGLISIKTVDDGKLVPKPDVVRKLQFQKLGNFNHANMR